MKAAADCHDDAESGDVLALASQSYLICQCRMGILPMQAGYVFSRGCCLRGQALSPSLGG
jgi:hypothetical protein